MEEGSRRESSWLLECRTPGQGWTEGGLPRSLWSESAPDTAQMDMHNKKKRFFSSKFKGIQTFCMLVLNLAPLGWSPPTSSSSL